MSRHQPRHPRGPIETYYLCEFLIGELVREVTSRATRAALLKPAG